MRDYLFKDEPASERCRYLVVLPHALPFNRDGEEGIRGGQNICTMD